MIFGFLLLLIHIFCKKRKKRKMQSRRRMDRGTPKLFPRKMPVWGHGQIVDLEMQEYCVGDQNGRIYSESTSLLHSEVSNKQSNQPETKCTRELQNSVPVVEKKGSAVPPKSSVNTDGDQERNSIDFFPAHNLVQNRVYVMFGVLRYVSTCSALVLKLARNLAQFCAQFCTENSN